LVSFFSLKSHAADPTQISFPRFEGDTLYIEGPIQSHLYDALARSHEALRGIKTVSLNSFGGNHYWALELARKIKEFGLNTVIEEGSVCASACVYLFGVGQERTMADGTWLGFHGARLAGGHVVTFMSLCPQENYEQGINQSEECEEFLADVYEHSMNATDEALTLIEEAGVSTELRDYYFSLDDDPNWYRFNNVLKKPDLVISAENAFRFGLVTNSLSL
jgi:hypothetical protein